MIIYLDGDNSPNKRLEGIEKLTERDELHIYYDSTDGFFKKEKNTERLKDAKCKVTFNKVPHGSNAVDIAIAMAAALRANEEGEGVMALVSGDKHFYVIEDQIQAGNLNMIVSKEECISDALQKFGLLDIRTVDDLRDLLESIFENGYGERLFNLISFLFEKKQDQYLKELPSVSRTAGMLNSIKAYTMPAWTRISKGIYSMLLINHARKRYIKLNRIRSESEDSDRRDLNAG